MQTRRLFPHISDNEFMWRVQEINMTICQPLFAQMNDCQSGESRFSTQQCKDISVLYNGCLLSALDPKAKSCIDKAQNNPNIKNQTDLISHVTNCLTSDGVKQSNEMLSTKLAQISQKNPMREVIHNFRALNNRFVGAKNECQYKSTDSATSVEQKVSKATNLPCKEYSEALVACVTDLEKNGHNEFTPMCFKEIVQRNFCLSSMVCAEQLQKCTTYVNRQKKIHQVSYD
jgi:hypothetical protein